jgi:hypothetical protein
MALHTLRRRFVDAPDSYGARRRARRWFWMADLFPELRDMSILDLGGRVDTWSRAPFHPKNVHIVNLETDPILGEIPDWAEVSYGDACALPEEIAVRRYDLVFSNSVIEHVGGHERRTRFAETVRTLGAGYWVQTPYRYFPIEPHWVAPGMQFMPVRVRQTLARRWPLAHTPVKDSEQALRNVLWTELIDKTQMRHYFPDAKFRNEKVLGLTKSLIAYRRP